MAPVAAAALVSCTNGGNTGQSVPDASLVETVPWMNGVLPHVDDAGNAIFPQAPEDPPIATGEPDPGSRTTSAACSALAGLEFDTFFNDTFEPQSTPTATDAIGVAAAWTAFDDSTVYSWHVPGDVSWYPDLSPPGGLPQFTEAFGLPAEKDAPPSCDGKPNNWSLHYRGGLFRDWGGGVSKVFTALHTDSAGNCPQDADICPPAITPGPGVLDTAGLPTEAYDGGMYAAGGDHLFVDASAYEGVSFWARTGPEGESNLLVTITDNFTSDRLARLNQKFCRRLKACYTRCENGAPCTPTHYAASNRSDDVTVYRCIPFYGDGDAGVVPGNISNDALMDFMYPRCGPSACIFRETYPDPDFEGKDCRPYTFPAGDISGEYCFNANDPPPPDRDEQCLDGWMSSVVLSTDWQFYTIPFTSMHQGGFGKQAPYFNTKAMDTIAFTFIVGWADVYIDNVTFYRRKN
jgi:hypothetical protein